MHSNLMTRPETVALSDEQQRMVDAVVSGRDVIVDATVGSGKTTSIQQLCAEVGRGMKVLYLTYSKLLKLDAQHRVLGAKVQNYHGIVYPALKHAGLNPGISNSIRTFNAEFKHLSANFQRYDLIVIDEYQDINEEYAQLLRNLKSLNPLMQVVMVGDLSQKVQANSVLDAQGFAAEFCDDPALVPFTQSFRVGPEIAELLSEAWNKPITGSNTDQRVHYVTADEAMDMMLEQDPGDLLCLGKRNGAMSAALNTVEGVAPEIFNKNTVYASIREGDSGVTYGDDAAVFTTFDGSKGMERKTSIVFDYEESNWDLRLRMPNSKAEILRNVFLVAASRGKDDVVFVKNRSTRPRSASVPTLGYIPTHRFTELPDFQRPVYKRPMPASECFDFKYAENVVACMELLECERLDDSKAEPIDINRTDGLIDLSPAVGHYQEALYFDKYNAADDLMSEIKETAAMLVSDLSGDPWKDSLVLAAADTEQMRYVDQVRRSIPVEARDELKQRLATQLPADALIQEKMELAGEVVHTKSEKTGLRITGVADAIYEGKVFELKFVTELDHAMFLQLGLYLAMSGYEEGVLWNTRTDERWSVRIPDESRFLNAVALCVTKQNYRAFKRS